MELELKYLAPYLPYGLKLKLRDKIIEMQGLISVSERIISYDIDKKLCECEISLIKPILRPLSDLLKNEFENVYKNQIDYESIEHLSELDCESFLTCNFSYEFWQSLFKNHFDVFGLIEKGLAIDINTIKK